MVLTLGWRPLRRPRAGLRGYGEAVALVGLGDASGRSGSAHRHSVVRGSEHAGKSGRSVDRDSKARADSELGEDPFRLPSCNHCE